MRGRASGTSVEPVADDGQPLRLRTLCSSGAGDAQAQPGRPGEPPVEGAVPLLSKRQWQPRVQLARPGPRGCVPGAGSHPGPGSGRALSRERRGGSEADYGSSDADWLEGYATALGHAFALYLQEQARQRSCRSAAERRAARKTPRADRRLGAHPGPAPHAPRDHIPACEAPTRSRSSSWGKRAPAGRGGALHPHLTAPGATGPSWRSTAPKSATSWPRARFFGHKKGPSRGAGRQSPVLPRGPSRHLVPRRDSGA